jgi:ribosomal protein S18 acetylase RimI-like enzyme
METFTLRKATLNDAQPIGHLFDQYRQFYEQPADLATATAFIRERMERNESVILYACGPAGEPLGFCQLYPSFCSVAAARIYALYDLFVVPRLRQSGIGKALMLAAHDQARADGMARMDLTTAKTNLKAQALYESLGWQRDEVFFAYHWEPAAG